jgi:hypothetical protein
MDRKVVYDAFVAGLGRDRPALLATMAPAFFGTEGPGSPGHPRMQAVGHRAIPSVLAESHP